MLKRFSSLVLVLAVGGSVFAGTARLSAEHVCTMSGMEMMPNMETMPGKMAGMENMAGMDMPDTQMSDMKTMPCCKKNQAEAATEEPSNVGQCCVTIPQEPSSTATTINLRSPSFSIAITHPAVMQPTLSLPKPGTRPHVTQVFLPNLQASYVRNLSFLI